MFEGFEQQVPLDTVREHAEITCRGKLEASGARFGTGPRTNLAGLEQLTGVSVRSAQTSTELPHFLTAVHEICDKRP